MEYTEGIVSMVGIFVRLSAIVGCVAVLGGCGPADAGDTRSAGDSGEYSRGMPSVAPVDWSARGTVVQSSDHLMFSLDELPPGSSARNMVYRSVSGITGSPTVVSGAVFIPPGPPPQGGWPVIGYAHGTVGLSRGCGPTQDPHLFGDISAVAIQLKQGYAVAYTDYAGLGEIDDSLGNAGAHAYLEPKSAAFNLIDAVRAARFVAPELSSRWVALGASQGGAAAWAAAEYYPLYGNGTDLLGAAALVPTLDMSGLVQRAEDSSLTTDQLYLYPYVVNGLAAVDDSIQPNDYLHGVMHDNQRIMLACKPPDSEQKSALADKLSGADAQPSSPEAADRLRRRLEAYALPQLPAEIPLMTVYGSADDTVPPQWTELAMGRGCALHDNVLRVREEDQGHSLDPGAILGTWVSDRFAGVPAAGNC